MSRVSHSPQQKNDAISCFRQLQQLDEQLDTKVYVLTTYPWGPYPAGRIPSERGAKHQQLDTEVVVYFQRTLGVPTLPDAFPAS